MTALRQQAGLTQEAAADALQRARATLGRMEEGHEAVRFRDIEVRAMLELYKASEEDSRVLLALTAETRNGRRKSWWHDYTETELPEWFGLYVTLEDSAETIRQYESELVPGLLQTRAYAEQVTLVPAGHVTAEEIERRVNVRLARQAILHRRRPPAPQLDVILNESVLHRAGDERVMTEQFGHLLDLGRQTDISIRILPFATGVHGGMASAFAMLDFPRDPRTNELLEPTLVYVDTLTGAMYLQKPDEVDAYELAWRDLEGRALDEAASRKLINDAMKGLTRG